MIITRKVSINFILYIKIRLFVVQTDKNEFLWNEEKKRKERKKKERQQKKERKRRMQYMKEKKIRRTQPRRLENYSLFFFLITEPNEIDV